MAIHRLKLVYDGLAAADSRMPVSLEKQVTFGAQILLGAHAAYFTECAVPDRIMDRSRHYQLSDVRSGDVRANRFPWAAEYHLEILGLGTFDLNEVVWDLAQERIGDELVRFLHQSIAAWMQRRPAAASPHARLAALLDTPPSPRHPILDLDGAEAEQRHRLYQRTDEAMARITTPLGRAATGLDIWLDGELLTQFERRVFTDEDIARALSPLKAGWAPGASH